MTRIHVLVRGRVQGVGFRWFVRERAEALALAGWVRNRPDGSVEILAAGSSSALEQLTAALKAGPHGAQVEKVETLASDIEPENAGFQIVR